MTLSCAVSEIAQFFHEICHQKVTKDHRQCHLSLDHLPVRDKKRRLYLFF